MYVQYGCGWSAPPSWANFDASPTLVFERVPFIGRLYTRNVQRFPDNVRYGDIVRGLPIGTNSCSGIYCSHVLEHLALSDIDVALTNTYGYLQAEGIFRLVIPDLRQIAQSYLADGSSASAHRFMKETGLGQERRPRGIVAFVKQWLGNSAHLWMWDEASMKAKLAEHGFVRIRRAEFGDSEDWRFREVENRERFVGCLAIQCTKA